MKTDTLKKSLLDYAIKGRLSAKFRRENSGLNAFDELEIYNDKIREKRKNLEKELKTLESKLKKAPTRHCETSAGGRGNPQNKQELKSQIQSLKKELAKCKEITPLNLSEAPFEIPNSWAWVKLGDICEIFTGDSINATEKEKNFTHQTSGLNYIATKDLANDTSITYENGIKIPDEFLPSFKIAKANSTLLCIEGGSAGRKVGFLKENVCFGNKLCCFENIFAFSKFVFYFLQSGEFSKEFNSNINGIIGGVKKESIRHFLIPLPPLYEQQEIVKKLDLLVTLANDFAITKENLKRIEKRIEKSLLKLALEGSLSKLYRRSSPTLSAFDEINTYNEAIKEKRKDLEKELKTLESTLKKAPARHCETSAESISVIASERSERSNPQTKQELKSQIQSLKKEIAKCKEITPLMTMDCHEVANATSRNDNLESTLPVIASERRERGNPQTTQNPHTPPFEIPNSWAWVKLGDICEMKKGPFGSAITKDMFIPNGNNAVKIYEQKNAIQKSETLGEYYISLEHFEKLKQFEVFENDIIVSCAGTIGEIFRIPKNAPKGIINQALMKIKLVNEEWIPYFMIFFDFLIKQKSQENSKGSAIKNIPPLDILKNFSIPLPPLCEQEHIVQTLDTLFTLKKGLRVD
ncbi:restriction endonuclease subunit S [Campylobacter upsaliensis]|nr:restriction endonuclease subunit S [Campylobacter upsaliensis]